MGTAVKHPVPDWVKRSFVIFDIRALRATNITYNKKAVLPQGNRAMLQVFFSVEVRQQHSLQV